MKKILNLLVLGTLASLGSVPALAALPALPAPPAAQFEIIGPYQTDVFPLIGFAGELNRIVVRGGSQTDLDLFVYDENDNLIASDTDSTSLCIVSWVPRWSGPFTVRVVNRGRFSNGYTITLTTS
jgi:hypothetical protein